MDNTLAAAAPVPMPSPKQQPQPQPQPQPPELPQPLPSLQQQDANEAVNNTEKKRKEKHHSKMSIKIPSDVASKGDLCGSNSHSASDDTGSASPTADKPHKQHSRTLKAASPTLPDEPDTYVIGTNRLHSNSSHTHSSSSSSSNTVTTTTTKTTAATTAGGSASTSTPKDAEKEKEKEKKRSSRKKDDAEGSEKKKSGSGSSGNSSSSRRKTSSTSSPSGPSGKDPKSDDHNTEEGDDKKTKQKRRAKKEAIEGCDALSPLPPPPPPPPPSSSSSSTLPNITASVTPEGSSSVSVTVTSSTSQPTVIMNTTTETQTSGVPETTTTTSSKAIISVTVSPTTAAAAANIKAGGEADYDYTIQGRGSRRKNGHTSHKGSSGSNSGNGAPVVRVGCGGETNTTTTTTTATAAAAATTTTNNSTANNSPRPREHKSLSSSQQKKRMLTFRDLRLADDGSSSGGKDLGGLISGRWRLTGVLGDTGLQGKTFAGRAVGDGAPCADITVKEIKTRQFEAAQLSRLRRTFPALIALDHPCLAHYYDLCFSEGRLYSVAELARGMPLGDLIDARQCCCAEPLVAGIAAQVLAALAYIHGDDAGALLHGDIHANNIVVDTVTGAVRVVDLSLKRFSEMGRAFSSSTPVYGRPNWLPPEVVNMFPGYCRASDVWALGCACVEALTGAPPFAALGPHQIQVLNAVLTKTPHPAEAAMKEASDELKSFLGECFVYEYERRPKAAELLRHPFIKKYLGASSSSPSAEMCNNADNNNDDNSEDIDLERCKTLVRDELAKMKPVEGFTCELQKFYNKNALFASLLGIDEEEALGCNANVLSESSAIAESLIKKYPPKRSASSSSSSSSSTGPTTGSRRRRGQGNKQRGITAAAAATTTTTALKSESSLSQQQQEQQQQQQTPQQATQTTTATEEITASTITTDGSTTQTTATTTTTSSSPETNATTQSVTPTPVVTIQTPEDEKKEFEKIMCEMVTPALKKCTDVQEYLLFVTNGIYEKYMSSRRRAEKTVQNNALSLVEQKRIQRDHTFALSKLRAMKKNLLNIEKVITTTYKDGTAFLATLVYGKLIPKNLEYGMDDKRSSRLFSTSPISSSSTGQQQQQQQQQLSSGPGSSTASSSSSSSSVAAAQSKTKSSSYSVLPSFNNGANGSVSGTNTSVIVPPSTSFTPGPLHQAQTQAPAQHRRKEAFSGLLEVMDSTHKWKRRWVILKNNFVFLFKTSGSSGGGGGGGSSSSSSSSNSTTAPGMASNNTIIGSSSTSSNSNGSNNSNISGINSESGENIAKSLTKVYRIERGSAETVQATEAYGKENCFRIVGIPLVFCAARADITTEWVAAVNRTVAWFESGNKALSNTYSVRIFEVSPTDLAARDPAGSDPFLPSFFCVLADSIIKWGLKTEGIFRISASTVTVKALRSKFEASPRAVDVDISGEDAHSLAALMKSWLRQLPPFVDPPGDQPILEFIAQHPDLTQGPVLLEFRRIVKKVFLPSNLAVLKKLSELIIKVAANEKINKMSLSNIYVCLLPALNINPTILGYFIKHFRILFGDF